jgi:hypothetical protein
MLGLPWRRLGLARRIVNRLPNFLLSRLQGRYVLRDLFLLISELILIGGELL